jgi:hypothetical protein
LFLLCFSFWYNYTILLDKSPVNNLWTGWPGQVSRG